MTASRARSLPTGCQLSSAEERVETGLRILARMIAAAHRRHLEEAAGVRAGEAVASVPQELPGPVREKAGVSGSRDHEAP